MTITISSGIFFALTIIVAVWSTVHLFNRRWESVEERIMYYIVDGIWWMLFIMVVFPSANEFINRMIYNLFGIHLIINF